MKVYWSETAQHHLDSIYTYIARDSSQYALRTVDKITARSIQLSHSLYSGRKVKEYDHDSIREVIEGS